MLPLRISVTTLESFRLYLTTDWMTEERFVRDLTQPFRETPEMRAGKAFHSILEDPAACRSEHGYSAGGLVFPADVVEPCLAICRPGVHEVKVEKVYHVHGEPVTVVAKCDQLDLLDVVERKTKWSQFDIDAYYASCQWRFYVEIFEARRVRYDVFRLSVTDRDGYRLDGIESFTCWPYPALAGDCRELLASFVEFVNLRGLHQYLQPRAA